MTSPFAATVDREQLIRAGHHPLAFCEHCGQPIDGALADCPKPDCQRKALDLEMYFVRLEDGLDDGSIP